VATRITALPPGGAPHPALPGLTLLAQTRVGELEVDWVAPGLWLGSLDEKEAADPLLFMRRMLGLFAFFYGALHFTTYFWLDQWFDLAAIVKDIVKRPFITMGFAAFVLMIPLAVTSTDAMVRRLGRRWGKLHRLVYAVAIAAILHYWWHKAGKNDFSEVGWYVAVVITLLGWRLVDRWRRRVVPRVSA
jgi:sulfoxide reductase heme-binding subunit YedZ